MVFKKWHKPVRKNKQVTEQENTTQEIKPVEKQLDRSIDKYDKRNVYTLYVSWEFAELLIDELSQSDSQISNTYAKQMQQLIQKLYEVWKYTQK